MHDYPEAVAQIVEDYLVRLKDELAKFPSEESGEILVAIKSHLYESYQHEPGPNDVARILSVLRRMGTPSEVAAGSLATALVSEGAQRSLPLYLLNGALLALFGVPLGVGGVAVLLGALGTVIAVVLAYYMTTGAVLALAAVLVLSGGTVAFYPTIWDRLVDLGVVRLSSPAMPFLDSLSPKEEGLLLLIVGMICLAFGLGMLRVGRYLLRGLRSTLHLAMSSLLTLGSRLLRRWRSHNMPSRPRLNLRSAVPRMSRREA